MDPFSFDPFESDASELVVPASHPTTPSGAPDTDPVPVDWEVLEELRKFDESLKTLERLKEVEEFSTEQIP